ncbi:ERF family protein [Variovorax paradoxus]|nr:ERF family protein [Variovorax paradoxus]
MSTVLKESPLTLEMIEPEERPVPAVRPASNVVQAPAAGPMGNAIAWLQAGGTMDQLRDMLALQREYEADQAKKAYVAAMAEFKLNPPTILKDKRVHFDARNGGTATDYWHATLGNVADAITEGLAKVGVSHSWKPERKGDRVHVTCTLTHKLGHSESIELDGPLDASGNKNNIQQMSSTTTYLSRYTLLMITGLAVKDEIMPDDDGRSAAPPPAPQAPPAPPAYPQEGFDKNLVAWRQLIETGKKTPDQILATLATKGQPTEEQTRVLRSYKKAV